MKVLSDILYVIVYHVVRYRRKVTSSNLRHAYPERSDKERQELEKAYYHHICDLLLEGIHNLYAHPMSIMKRYHFVNHRLVNQYYERGQSIILMSAHYNNWEYMITSLNYQLMHHGVGVGKPLNDKFVANYITRRRGRFGTEIVDQTNVRQTIEYYQQHRVPVAYMMLSDQSPNDVHKCYWTTFMHQETPFIYGAEYFARKYNMPVLYYEVTKIRRGYYEVKFSTICDKPNEVPQYSIIAEYIRRLNRTIDAAPQYWLWSHRRWKRTRPAEVPLHDHNTDNTLSNQTPKTI